MNPQRPSVTAAVVAWARAASSPDDDVTPSLLPRAYHRALRWTSPQRLGKSSLPARRLVSAGLLDHMRLRTAAIDALLLQAVAQGAKQLVLLGAGLDARAYRLAELADVAVFEVDHPASQRYKLAKVRQRTPVCAALHHVAVDFGTDPLDVRLGAAGYKQDVPSFWIWEGMTMYLPRSATETTLHAIAALSCPGSQLALTYVIPQLFGGGRSGRWVNQLFGAIDEPLVGGMTPQAVRRLLRDAGFMALSDGCNWDWAAQMGVQGAGWATLFRSERLAFAARASSTAPASDSNTPAHRETP